MSKERQITRERKEIFYPKKEKRTEKKRKRQEKNTLKYVERNSNQWTGLVCARMCYSQSGFSHIFCVCYIWKFPTKRQQSSEIDWYFTVWYSATKTEKNRTFRLKIEITGKVTEKEKQRHRAKKKIDRMKKKIVHRIWT